MKVMLVSSADLEGGAARAAYRLFCGLEQLGVVCSMHVQSRSSQSTGVVGPKTRLGQGIAQSRLGVDALPLKLYPGRSKGNFSVQWLPDNLVGQIATTQPDIINLHWVNDGFVCLESIGRIRQPVVWTLHDMWAFTGGCHYAYECDRYQENCGICPQLHSQYSCDLSRWIWQRKLKAWQALNLTIVTPSNWLADCARRSSLFRNHRIEVIPNGIDIGVYRPVERQWARDILQLPQDKKLILFGAIAATSDARKGFHLLQPALQMLSQSDSATSPEVVVFGAEKPPQESSDFGTKVHYLGSLKDDISLNLAYSAADVFVLPSLEENLANTLLESLACGTPCVAFNIGGMPDIIEHQVNGYLADPYSVFDLANGLSWILEDQQRWQVLSKNSCQKIASNFTQTRQAQHYQKLYEGLKVHELNHGL